MAFNLTGGNIFYTDDESLIKSKIPIADIMTVLNIYKHTQTTPQTSRGNAIPDSTAINPNNPPPAVPLAVPAVVSCWFEVISKYTGKPFILNFPDLASATTARNSVLTAMGL